jgi:hypothetical protein
LKTWQHKLLETVTRRTIDLIALTYIFDLDGNITGEH